MARQPLQSIQIAPELEREARAGQQIAVPPSDGLAEAASGLAREFSGIGAKIGALADHAAAVEGKQAGHIAGMDPEFRTRNDLTIRGEAYDRAALDTAKSRIAVGIHNDIEQVQQQNPANPAAIGKILKEKASGWLNGAPPELQPEIQIMFAKGAMAAQREATRTMLARQAEEQKGALTEELTRTLRTVHQRAFSMGLDPESDRVLADDVTSLSRILQRRGPNGQPLVSPAQAATMLANAKEQVSAARLEGAFERLPTIEAKQQFLKTLDEDFAGSKGAAAAFDFQTFKQVRNHLESELRRDESKARQGNATLTHLVTEVQKRADKGYAVDRAEMAALEGRVATTNNPELTAALLDAKDSLQFQAAARRLPLADLESVVGQLRQTLATEPPSITDRGRTYRRLEKAEALLTEAQGKLKDNPLGWEARVGMIELTPLGKVDMRDPAAVQAWAATRVSQAEEAATRHGLGKPKYLEPVERRALAKQFERGGEAGLAAVTMLTQAFGDKAESVLAELGKDAPAGALVGRLAVTAGRITPAVLDASEGLALKARDGYKPLAPPESKSRVEAQSLAGTALGHAPEYMSAAMRVADAIYETRANREGKRDVFDAKIWKQALSEALGEVDIGGQKYGGIVKPGGFFSSHRVVIPPSIAQDKAAATFAAITPDDLGAAFGSGPQFSNGRALTRSELRGATLVTIAPGRYLLATKDPSSSDPGWALDGNRQPFVLDIDKVLPGLRRRRPDLK